MAGSISSRRSTTGWSGPSSWPDALRNLFEDFYAAVDAGTTGAQYAPTFASFSDAARVQAVVEAVLRSDATGVWVDVDDIVKEVSM